MTENTPSGARDIVGEAPGLVRLTDDVLFGEVWNRELLSRRDRSLVTVACLLAGGSHEQLRFHLQFAKDNGVRGRAHRGHHSRSVLCRVAQSDVRDGGRQGCLLERRARMRGVVLHGPGDVRVEERDAPQLEATTDAVIRASATCVCGSDLWSYRGTDAVQQPTPVGHEYVGIVEEVDADVRTVAPGQFVVGSQTTTTSAAVRWARTSPAKQAAAPATRGTATGWKTRQRVYPNVA